MSLEGDFFSRLLENNHKEIRPMQPGLKVRTPEWKNQPWSKANVVLAMHLGYIFSTVVCLLLNRKKFLCRLVILNNG